MKKWVISSMDTAPLENDFTDVVKTVHWRRVAEEVDGEKKYYGYIYGSMACAAPEAINFKPYNELTFQDICTWLEENIDVNSLDKAIDNQIYNQKNPPIIQLPLPWDKNIQDDLDNSVDSNS